jgi:DNA adenine methylase
MSISLFLKNKSIYYKKVNYIDIELFLTYNETSYTKRGIYMSNKNIAPFVKWAGGKRQLLERIVEGMPQRYVNYFEPFIGGGAVLFGLQPENALINDINESLINTYKVIANSPKQFIECVKEIDSKIGEDGKTYYYSLREHYNDKLMKDEFDIELAALFVFINKHCFNGLYRVNGKGLFNVPYNNSKRESIDEESIVAVSDYLKDVTIMSGDFEVACQSAGNGDFVFLDSPYAPLNPTSFESYTKEGFDIESHKRLARVFDELTERGCYCMLTNHNTDFINSLYGNKGYKIDVVSVKRMINSDASKRTGEEVIICNY